MRPLIRLLAFAVGGTLGAFLVLLFLSRVTSNGLTLIVTALGVNLPFPASLLVGTALGVTAWLGFILGHAHWTYLAQRPGHSLYRMPVVIALIAIYLIFGVTLGILGAVSESTALPPWVSATLLIILLPVGVPLGYGYLSGFGARPPAFYTVFVGVLYGALCGFWLALVAGIAILIGPPPIPSPSVRFVVSPVTIAILLIPVLTGLGLALGIVTGFAEGLGLLLCPPAPITGLRGGAVPPAA